ncbi:Putative ribonuclease H protein At1g65750 [Linum perenne]
MFAVGDVLDAEGFASRFGCEIGKFPSLYLGLPFGVRAVSKALWDPVVACVTNRLAGWKARLLSFGGRLTLLKSVLSSLPVYYMSLFRAPVSVVKRIESIQCRFLWEGCSEERRFHLVNWKMVKAAKVEGGLGVVDLKSMNSALLAKWAWRFGKERTAWWRQLIVDKCGSGVSEWRPFWKRSTSGWSVWRWIVTESLCLWEFGYVDPGGGWVSFWFDFWVSGVCLSEKYPRVVVAAQSQGAWVSDYLCPLDRSQWRIPMTTTLRGGAERERRDLMQFLDAIPESVLSEGPATLNWPLEKSGCFTVRSLARRIIKRSFEGCVEFPTEVVWASHVPTKVSCLVWKVAHESLATVDKLRLRGLSMPNRCVMCCADGESVRHLFWTCQFAREVWSFFSSRLSVFGPLPIDAKGFLWAWKGLNCDNPFEPCFRILVHSVLWVLWSERNSRIFRDRSDNVQAVVSRIAYWVGLWCRVGGLIHSDVLSRSTSFHNTSHNTNSTHIHTSTTQLTIHSFTVTDINQAQPNQSLFHQHNTSHSHNTTRLITF